MARRYPTRRREHQLQDEQREQLRSQPVIDVESFTPQTLLYQPAPEHEQEHEPEAEHEHEHEHEQEPPPRALPTSLPIFRTWDKILDLYNLHAITKDDAERITSIPKYIPRKQMAYSFSHVHDYNSWMVDIVFFHENCLDYRFNQYEQQILNRRNTQRDIENAERLLQRRKLFPVCIFLHCNSRVAEAFFLSTRHHTVQDLIPCFQRMLAKYQRRFSTIISDAAPEFSAVIRSFGDRLRHIPINMSDPENYHTLLAPIDRFVRTLRDMLFNLRRHHINVQLGQQILDRVCELYNQVSHSTLSKVMGFPLSPIVCFSNHPIETEFVRRIAASNYGKYISDLRTGSEVYVYQPREPFVKRRNSVMDDMFRVLGFNKGRYHLQNTNNPTSQIHHLRSRIVRP